MGILDHLKKALVLAHAINSPGRVKNLMSAVSVRVLIVGTRVYKTWGGRRPTRNSLGRT